MFNLRDWSNIFFFVQKHMFKLACDHENVLIETLIFCLKHFQSPTNYKLQSFFLFVS